MSKPSADSEWALLLSPEAPYPLAGGGAIRTASMLHFLAARYRVHLVSFRVEHQEGSGVEWPPGTVTRVDWVSLPHHGRSSARRAARNAARLARGVLPLSDRFSTPDARRQLSAALDGRRYGVAVVEHFWCASCLPLLRRHARSVAINLHNIESALHHGCAASEPAPARWAHRAFAAIAARQEREWLPRFDLVLAASEADRRRVLVRAPGTPVEVYENAIPLRTVPPVEEQHCIAFSGNLEYHPNTSAVRYFARRIWPQLRRAAPELRWRIIGKNDWAVRSWTAADPRIERTGPVDDALAELARARVVVVPLLTGSGTRVKILEAWAAGRAVVSTSVGAEGLPAVDGENLLIADAPGQFVAAVQRLLGDSDLRRRLGEAGRRLVEQRLCWPAVWEKLDKVFAQLGPAASGAPRLAGRIN